MITGVTIDNINTLEQYNLALCADLKIGKPALKSTWVDVPGADGALNMSYAMTGRPVYQMRDITFRLISVKDTTGNKSGAPETEFAEIRSALINLCHGKEKKLILPDDGNHYFLGVFDVGDKENYNQPIIPVSVKAYPWRYKNAETTVSVTIPAGGSKNVQLTNEQKRVMPSFTTTGAATVTFGSVSHNFGNGTYEFEDIVLEEGNNTVTLTGASGTVIVIKYQEAVL